MSSTLVRSRILVRSAACTTLLAALLTVSTASTVSAAPVRIMALGDSITAGLNGDLTYRQPLSDRLREAAFEVDLVGTVQRPMGPPPDRLPNAGSYADPSFVDREHEGHGGFRADNVLNGMAGRGAEGRLVDWVAAADPDIVLVHLGTNDLRQCEGVASTLVDLDNVVDTLRAKNSRVTVLLGQIIPTATTRTGCAGLIDAQVTELNAGIAKLAASLDSQSSRVVSVDLNSGFDKAIDTVDGVHPATSGYKKMADDWFRALVSVLDSTSTPTTSTSAPKTTALSPAHPTSTTTPSTTTPSTTTPSATTPSATTPSATTPSATTPSATTPSATPPSATPPPTTEPPLAAAAYWLVDRSGDVAAVGGARELGSVPAGARTSPVVDIVASGSGAGYWVVSEAGQVFAFGDAADHGSLAGASLDAPVVGLAPTATGRGYWLLDGDGGVFSFGDAGFHGSAAGNALAAPAVAITRAGSNGYWVTAADGGVFSFGPTASFLGSLGAVRLSQPVVDIEPTGSGRGYHLTAADGGVFAFGDAVFAGSTGAIRLAAPVVAMAAAVDGGYWLFAADGGIFAFGSARYAGRHDTVVPSVGIAAP